MTRLKNPKGGLTAAGRARFAARDGSHLKPGVKVAGRAADREEGRAPARALRYGEGGGSEPAGR